MTKPTAMIRRLFSLSTLMLLLASCTNAIDNVENLLQRAGADSELPVFYATIEGSDDAATKVFADDQLRVLWNADDRITVFNKYSYGYEYAFTGQDGDNAGEFAAVPNNNIVTGNALDHVYALYPHNSATKISNDGAITATLPSQQAYKANSFGIGANTMMSVTDDTQLRFKNVGGYLSFKFYGEGVSVKHITLRGNNHEKLAGKVSITMPVGGTPTVEMQEDATESITLTCETPVGLGADVEHYTEFWFVLPPTTFTQGFTVTVIDRLGGIFEKSTSGPITISRNRISHLSPIEVKTDYTQQLTIEREALIAIYNALDGNNWTNNNNWCSDKPVGEWHGISTNSVGLVTSLDLYDNNLSGTIPPEIGKLPNLFFLRFRHDNINGTLPNELFTLSHLAYLTLDELHLDSGVIPEEINQLSNLIEFSISSHNNELVFPEDLSGLTKLRELHIGNYFTAGCKLASLDFLKHLKGLEWLDFYYMEITIPECIGDLLNLKKLDIMNCTINGSIPSSIGNLSNLETLDLRFNSYSLELPKEIGNLTNLTSLFLYTTPFSGTIPKEFGALTNLKFFEVGYNNFSGELPQEVASLPVCKKMWPTFYDHTGLDLSNCRFPAPDFDVTDLDGNRVCSADLYANHKLTILYEWATWCGAVSIFTPILKQIFDEYHNEDVYILGYGEMDSNTDEETARNFVADNQFPWPNVFWTYDYSTATEHNEIYRITVFPLVCVYDQENHIIFNSYSDDINKLQLFISDYLSE